MTKGHHGHHESYAEKEAHKLEKLYKDEKPLADELNKIRKERPGEYNKIFQTMNHHANVDKTLPHVEFFQDGNRELKITLESSNKEHNPLMQRAEQYGVDTKTNKWKQDDATLKTAGKVVESMGASVGDAVAGAGNAIAEPLKWLTPGPNLIEKTIHAATEAAKKASQS